ncbi:fumarylacetoacetate hydrolase family protein [Halobacillus halophilus]|uniref:fumarylacetoacetate hydrolase family protein n=1 Tax=Halobacillus halophilus TaxID=1570 RepID=UPI001CD3F3FE|nr:fumarylacetoacetate hydrolase family protein [Halobacillus halophilus]MCA1010469.1 fumarylacetoacetate hydrolase family protein [Halobacillus halophilus]
MRFLTIEQEGIETAAVLDEERNVITVQAINEKMDKAWPTDLFELLQSESFERFKNWWDKLPKQEKESLEIAENYNVGPLYRRPRKIWGIGLNYVDHASDLEEQAPQKEPASFMKPDTTIIGHEGIICIPTQSERTTGEAELGIIIGQTCKDVPEEEADQVVAGYTTIIDMTAEDILKQNPRYLTRAKSFDTFFSFGPELITPEEVNDVRKLNVTTTINGRPHRKNEVNNMTFDPDYLVSFHSKVMTLLPGDIISTGTPGAVVIRDGDVIECQIDGFTTLRNSVKDLKDNEKG